MIKRKHSSCLMFIATLLISCILLASCEADPHGSTYQREKRAGNVIDRSDDYSQDEYNSYIFADQPTTEDEFNRLGITAYRETLTTTAPEIRTVCREQILGFAHAWMQFGYTYSKESDFDKVSGFLTDELSQSFAQSPLVKQKFTDVQLRHVISDISSVNFYDQYCKEYTTADGEEILRIKAEVIVRMSGDEEYYVENPNINKGDVCYELYFYFRNEEFMPIYGIYEITDINKGICWYTDQEIVKDDSKLVLDKFTSLTGDFKFLKSDVVLPKEEKNKVCRRMSDFIGAFFNANQNRSDILTNGVVNENVLEAYGELINAVEQGEIIYDQNYVSYTMEMAFPDLSLYENDGMLYYVAKESLMLNALDGTASKFGLDYIETGLWKYSIYFVFRADDHDFHIVRLEIQPDSGPYESVGDLDAG